MTNIKRIEKWESIVIKKADKGGAVVIINSVHYEQMIYKQLEDKNKYKKMDPSCDNKNNGSKQHTH